MCTRLVSKRCLPCCWPHEQPVGAYNNSLHLLERGSLGTSLIPPRVESERILRRANGFAGHIDTEVLDLLLAPPPTVDTNTKQTF